MDELIICVAPCPGDNQEERFPGEMDLHREVIRSWNAGASIAHLHVRDREGRQTTETTLFKKQVKDIRSASPMIVEGSTGGTPEHTLEERTMSLSVEGIEMGSLNMGSVNMAGGVYQNPMSDIRYYASELKAGKIKPSLSMFDLSMFHNVHRLEEEGLLDGVLAFNFVLDVPDALPFSQKTLDIFIDQLPENSLWFLTRHHAKGWEGFRDALERGGHVRVGFEDGPFLSSGERAGSNAELVEEIANAARETGRRVVDPERAREIIGIKT